MIFYAFIMNLEANSNFYGRDPYLTALSAARDPNGHAYGFMLSGMVALRSSPILRRGECHGPCGLFHRVARPAARRGYRPKAWTQSQLDPGTESLTADMRSSSSIHCTPCSPAESFYLELLQIYQSFL
jgi:hypothetical protein